MNTTAYQDLDVFARVVDGKIVEYPVFYIHIKNRAEPLAWYTKVIFEHKPEVPAFCYAAEKVTLTLGNVVVTYEIKEYTFSNLIAQLIRANEANNVTNITDPNYTPVIELASIDAATMTQLAKKATEYVQGRLDQFANSRGYDGILSACSYKDSTNPAFAADAAIAIPKRDQAWTNLHAYLADVQSGVKPVPTSVQDITAQLPELVW